MNSNRRVSKSYLPNILLMFCSLLFSFLLVELLLRVIGFSYPNFYTFDKNVGRTHSSNSKGWYNVEGKAYIKINSDGLRDREHLKLKPPNTVRIAILGDSYAEAFQIPIKNTFWAVMEKMLNDCKVFGTKNVEVINFGVSGYGTGQALLKLRNHVWDYSPDIVLLAFFTGNDIINNSRELARYKFTPFFYLKEDRLVLDKSAINTFSYKRRAILRQTLSHYSRTFQLIFKLKPLKKLNEFMLDKKLSDYDTKQGVEAGIDENVYLNPINKDWEEAWKITEALLVKMRDEVQERQARFLVVTLSNGIQVHPDFFVRKLFTEKIGVKDLFYPDRRIKALGKREDIEVLTLAPYFSLYSENNGIYLHGFENLLLGYGHWNKEGHSLAGEMISNYFCDMNQ